MLGVIHPTASQGTQYPTDEAGKSRSKLGRNDFLKIFLAQLQHQDPLNPMEGTEFTAQLAQFSSLEQLFNVNENLGQIKLIQDHAARFQALSLIGKEITAQGDILALGQAGETSGAFSLNEPAECTVIIEDGSGNLIRKIVLGKKNPGKHSFTWDGRNELGNRVSAGSYRFSVLATDTSGAAVPAETFITGDVTKVNMDGNSPILYLGEVAVDLSQVLEVRMGEAGATESEDQDYSGPGV